MASSAFPSDAVDELAGQLEADETVGVVTDESTGQTDESDCPVDGERVAAALSLQATYDADRSFYGGCTFVLPSDTLTAACLDDRDLALGISGFVPGGGTRINDGMSEGITLLREARTDRYA